MFGDLIEELQPFARLLFDAASRAGLQPRVTSTRRSRSQQKRLYARFLAGLSPYPALPPGLSAHEYGFAFDMITSAGLEDVGYTWRKWGGIWGGPKDPVHFEYPGFKPPADSPDVDVALKACDFLSGFTPLGGVQTADWIAEMVSPLHSSPTSAEHSVQDFIQGPCSYLFGNR